ncbi:phospholipase D family protein [Homoserinimonas sp. OAct 916]|uniref:phospholipase D family protein n=1 Tax=Homoserinimonas sp. OAct 916 TaxID=2211450 RepID=UPI000DBE8BB7|nr:phospholipase D family protein [Homoserinimonas sp. OAct 916]
MLEPDVRAALTEQLRPPTGYELLHAVGTTFTLDLTSALAIPLAFAGHQVSESDDPVAILDAVRRAADLVDIFGQAGQIAVPREASDLVAFLEPMVHPVGPRRPGTLFHPKVWLLEYARGEHRSFRLLCSSRNITADRSWDLVVRLDGTMSAGGHTREQNEPLSELVRALPSLAVTALPTERARRIEDLAERVGAVEWEYPDDIRDLTFHALGLGRPTNIDFGGARHLIISPFLSDEGINRTSLWSQERAQVISRADSFERLQPKTLTLIEAHVLDDAVRDSDEADDDPLVGLHAKAYFLDRKSGSRAIIGSANATSAAFGGNIEFLIEMVGPQPRVGVHATFGEKSALRNLTVPYTATGGAEESETEKADRALEVAIRSLACVRLRNVVEQDGADSFALTVESIESHSPPSDIVTEIRLLTRPANTRAFPVENAARFEGIELTDITPFVIIRATDSRGEARSTIVCAELIGDVAHRRDTVLARQIDTPEKFLRFLFLMLSLGGATSTSAQSVVGSGGTFGSWTGDGSGVFESLVHALAKNPRGLDDLAKLIERMRAQEGTATVLPHGFDEVWEPIWQARVAQSGVRS